MIDYTKFRFNTYITDFSSEVSIDDCCFIPSEFKVIAEIDVNPQVTIRYTGFGKTKEEATNNCKTAIRNYLLP